MTARGRRAGEPGALTTADLVVLSLLAERPMHGYDLMREWARQEIADWASVSKAQVYYALQKLERLGLTRSVEDAGRDRAVYAPTPAGIAALADGLASGRWARSRIAQPFSTWVGLSMHLPAADRRAMIDRRRAFLKDELVRERASLSFIETLDGERARAGSAIVRLVIAQLETEQVWLETLAER